MIEMEQSTEGEVSESVESPAAQDSSKEAPESAKQEASTQGESKTQDNTPFHEHPRWKELIQQRNEFANRLKESDSRFQEMQARIEAMHKPVEQKNKLIERLKTIDPEFGEWAEKQEMTQKELAELREWKTQREQEVSRTQAAQTLDRLHQEFKVPKEAQDLYRAMIKDRATQNPRLTPADLPQVYKDVHDTLSKFLEAQKRSALSTYSAAKKADSKVPLNQKGQAPKASQKFEYSKDREEARHQLSKRVLELMRAGNDD